jgi:osmotically-inducible protein OsmY
MFKAKISILSAAIVAALLFIVPAGRADSVPVNDLTPQLASVGLNIDGFQAYEVGGVVILRGKATDRTIAERAGLVAQDLGFRRVANLIQIAEPVDDAAIQRQAERKLAMNRSLDGCTFHVDSHAGVLRVAGRVKHELQKDVTMGVLRGIDGVRSVKTELER